MPLLRSSTVCLLFLSVASAEPAFRFHDDFGGYPEGSGGEPHWDVNDIGFEVRNGALNAACSSQHGIAHVKAATPGKDVTIESRITPVRPLGKDWHSAGVAVMIDERNFWYIALAESPDGSKHFAELSEMLDGTWNAQSEPDTRLTTLEESGPFEWKYGTTYRLRLSLGQGGKNPHIRGEIFEGETSRYHCERSLDRKAVDHGKPVLTANAMAAVFDDVSVTIDQTMPAAVRTKFPAFVSSPLSTGSPRKATGFFRTEENAGTWWLVDPVGKPALSIGTDHVSYTSHWCEALGYAPYHKVVERKFGSEKAWAQDAVRRLREWNFTSLGTNASPEACHIGLPHTVAVSLGASFSSVASLVEKTYWTGFPDVFDPRFERFCDLRARQLCAPNRDDPWLIGYYIDNELEWWGKSQHPGGLVEDSAKLPASAAGKSALVASFSDSFGNDIGAFNSAFGTTFTSFGELKHPFNLPLPANDRGRAALDAFITEVATRYFRITTAAVRRHDPGHMLLGCRFAHDAPDPAWTQAGATCDIVTVNVYPRVDLPSAGVIGLEDHLKAKFKLCRRPMILTEWGFPSLDATDRDGKPLPCTQGAGMRVDTVEQKARCYAAVQRTLFSLPFIVGSHYFMWSDEPSLGISQAFPENSSYGLVSETDQAYAPLVATATRVNARMQALHAGKIRMDEIDPGNKASPADKNPPLPMIGGQIVLERTDSGYTIDTGALRAVKDQPTGDIFDRILWRAGENSPWIELGGFTCVLNTVTPTGKNWPHPDQAPVLTAISQNRDKLVIDVECHRAAPPSFRSCLRLTFHAGRPFFESQFRWIENNDPTPWLLAAGLYYPVSRIGGDASNDGPGITTVPNYWLKVATWHDPQHALHYGVLVPDNDKRIDCYFWKDTAQHPDCLRKIGLNLAPRHRWTADPDEPAVIVFGLQESPDNPRPWKKLTPAS